MKQELVRILRDIFTSSGYDVAESFSYDLVAEKNGQKTLIKLSYDPTMDEVMDFADQAAEGEGLYVIAGNADDDLISQAQSYGVRIWSRDDIALKIGRAVLADIEGTTEELDLLGQGMKRTQPRKAVSSVDDFAKEAIKAIFGTGSSPHVEKAALDGSSVSNRFKGTVRPAEQAQPVQVQYYRPREEASGVPHDVQEEHSSIAAEDYWVERPEETVSSREPDDEPFVIDLHTLPVNVTSDRAISISASHIRGCNTTVLKFVPFWKYSYSLDVEHRYRSKIVDISGDGSGCLNALNGNIENIHMGDVRDSVSIPNVEYDVKHPLTPKEDARKQILNMIIEEYTKDLRFDDVKGETIISEHKRFKPAVSDIDLSIELVHVPVWEVKGNKNSVEINAYSAEVLSNPVDNDVEFV